MRDAAQVLRHRDFRWLWLGQSVSTVGDAIIVVTLALFVTELTGSPSAVGLVLAAYTGSLVLFLLMGGVWADRLPRQRVMIATDLVRFGCQALLALLILTGWVELWHVVAIEVVVGAAEAFFRPAYSGLIPQTVPEDLIQDASAFTSATTSAAEFLGPALAVALVVSVGPGWAFAADAATFLVSAGFLLLVRPRRRGQEAERRGLLADLREGFEEVRSRTWVGVTIVVFSLAVMVGFAPFVVLGPTVAGETYGNAEAYGVVFASFGAGMLLGAVLGLRLRPARPMVAALVACMPWPVAFTAFALGLALPLVMAFAAVAGVGFALFDVWWNTALAQRVPPRALSRVTSYDWMGSLALAPLGYLLAGPIAEVVGGREVIGAGAALTLALLGLGLLPRQTRGLTRLASPEVDPVP